MTKVYKVLDHPYTSSFWPFIEAFHKLKGQHSWSVSHSVKDKTLHLTLDEEALADY